MTNQTFLAASCIATLFIACPVAAQRSPARSAELDKLGALVGTFEGDVRLERQGGEPLTGRMRYEARWELDSAWVVARYEQSLMGRTTSGLLMYTWDAKSRRYLFYGFPNTAMEPHRLQGAANGTAFVFEADTTTGTLAYRETWALVAKDTLITALSGKQGGAWIAGPRTVLVRTAR